MSGRRLRALLRKEWAEALRNRAVTGTFAVLALVFVALPLSIAFAPTEAMRRGIRTDPQVVALVDKLVAFQPAVAALGRDEQMAALLLRQLLPLFLILPLLGGMSVATFSIVGEKTGRSLEPLLATPVTSAELLLGKTLAAALPAVAGAWLAFAIFAGGVAALGGAAVARAVFDAAALLTMGLIGPLVGLLGIGAGVLVSARAQDPRGAQQIGAVIVLPVVALVVAQGAGVFVLGVPFVLGGAAVLASLDAAVFAWGARAFDRDRVFTRWR